MDHLSAALPYALPVALGVVTALVSPALITPRRLRQDLAIDAELVDKLPTQERVDLSADIKRRARHLIAVTRYPPLTLYDLLALLGHTAIVVFVIVGLLIPMARGEGVADPVLLGAPALFAGSCWGAFYVPWGTRAKARLEHIQEHLGDQEATEAARTVRVAYLLALLGGPGAIAIMQVALAIAVHPSTGPDYWLSGMALLGGIFALLALWFLAGHVGLFDTLLVLNERHQQERLALIEHEKARARKKQERQARGENPDAR